MKKFLKKFNFNSIVKLKIVTLMETKKEHSVKIALCYFQKH